MGIFKSLPRHDPEDDAPVMGVGYCPFYDAALVGDWDRLQILCDESKRLKGQSNLVKESIKISATSLNSLDEGYDHDDTRDRYTNENGSNFHIGQTEKSFVNEHVEDEPKNDEPKSDLGYSEQIQPFTLFVDKKGNTALHIACSRDPPVAVVRSLIALHPKLVWIATNNDWLPLHLACYCGCEVEVASELLNVMEVMMVEEQKHIQLYGDGDGDDDDDDDDDDYDDPLLPRESKGRTPLHLACSSSRNPQRRPDLVRLLLLQSKDPKAAVLTKDWIAFDHNLGDELASGDFRVILGGLSEKERGKADTNDASYLPKLDQSTKSISTGRNPLSLIEADFKEEIEGALQLGFPLDKAIEKLRGVDNNDLTTENLSAIYEAWAMLSVLLLSAGGIGTVERIKEKLGGVSNIDDETTPTSLITIVQDFRSIFEACSSLDDEICSPKIKELAKKFLEGEVDKRNIESVSDLKSKWENMANGDS